MYHVTTDFKRVLDTTGGSSVLLGSKKKSHSTRVPREPNLSTSRNPMMNRFCISFDTLREPFHDESGHKVVFLSGRNSASELNYSLFRCVVCVVKKA